MYYLFLVTKARVTVDFCWRLAGSKKKEKSVFSACVIGVGDWTGLQSRRQQQPNHGRADKNRSL
jgi:hypothetical protein